MTLAELNAASREAAARALLACCRSRRWVDGLLARRPFSSREGLLTAADAAWSETGPNDWHEALAGHPRLGESIARDADSRSKEWSAREQAGVSAATAAAQSALANVNREYEAQFGHIFLVAAAGRSAAQLIEIARQRMNNTADVEIGVAGEELHKIARLRLEKLIAADKEARR